MFKLFLVSIVFKLVVSARLPNNYLPPPNNAFTAGGGHGNFLQGPTKTNFGSYGGGSAAAQIPILRYSNVNNGDGSYQFDYATGNGIMHNEQGHLRNPQSENAEQVVDGQYSYTGPDGKQYTVRYKADSNGFQPVGDHLPTPPPIPEAIRKALAQNTGGSGGYSGRPQQQYLPPVQSHSGSYNTNTGYRY